MAFWSEEVMRTRRHGEVGMVLVKDRLEYLFCNVDEVEFRLRDYKACFFLLLRSNVDFPI